MGVNCRRICRSVFGLLEATRGLAGDSSVRSAGGSTNRSPERCMSAISPAMKGHRGMDGVLVSVGVCSVRGKRHERTDRPNEDCALVAIPDRRWWASRGIQLQEPDSYGQREIAFHQTAVYLPGELGLLLAVADGVGSGRDPEEASRIALSGIAKRYYQGEGDIPSHLERALRGVVDDMREGAWHAQTPASQWGAIQTTFTGCVVTSDGTVYVAHRGDSRCYLAKAGQLLRPVTRDHHGSLSENGLPYLTQVVSAEPESERPFIEQLPGRLGDGDALLLCTDGLSSVVSEHEMESVLVNYPAEVAAHELVGRAQQAGSADDITALVLKWSPASVRSHEGAADASYGVPRVEVSSRTSGPAIGADASLRRNSGAKSKRRSGADVQTARLGRILAAVALAAMGLMAIRAWFPSMFPLLPAFVLPSATTTPTTTPRVPVSPIYTTLPAFVTPTSAPTIKRPTAMDTPSPEQVRCTIVLLGPEDGATAGAKGDDRIRFSWSSSVQGIDRPKYEVCMFHLDLGYPMTLNVPGAARDAWDVDRANLDGGHWAWSIRIVQGDNRWLCQSVTRTLWLAPLPTASPTPGQPGAQPTPRPTRPPTPTSP